jgi:hypothetical protein
VPFHSSYIIESCYFSKSKCGNIRERSLQTNLLLIVEGERGGHSVGNKKRKDVRVAKRKRHRIQTMQRSMANTAAKFVKLRDKQTTLLLSYRTKKLHTRRHGRMLQCEQELGDASPSLLRTIVTSGPLKFSLGWIESLHSKADRIPTFSLRWIQSQTKSRDSDRKSK